MIAIRFQKAYAEQILQALKNGDPLPAPPQNRWSYFDMLQVAGILYAAIFSHGPMKESGFDDFMFTKAHPELKEALEDALNADIENGISFIGWLASKIMNENGQYDAQFEPEVEALLVEEQDGETTVVRRKGFKNK